MTCRLTALAAVLLAASALAVAPPPRPPLPADEARRLIEQLGARVFADRELADRRLRRDGAAVLPILREGLAHADPEVRRRLRRIVPAMELARLVAPKRVTFRVHNQPLGVVLAELSKASGYRVSDTGAGFGGMMFNPFGVAAIPAARPGAAPKGPAPKYSFAFEDVTFMEALDRICREARLTVPFSWGGDQIQVTRTVGPPAHSGTDGPFRYVAQAFRLERTLDLNAIDLEEGKDARSETLTFYFQIHTEPRLPFLGMHAPRVEAAYDDEKKTLVAGEQPFDPRFPGGNPFGGGMGLGGSGQKQLTMQVALPLKRGGDKAKTLKTLKGVVPVNLLMKQETVLLTDKVLSSKNTKVKAGDIEFTVEEAGKSKNNINNAQYEVKFTASGPGVDFNWVNTLYGRLELTDEKGAKFQHWGSSSLGGNQGRITMTMLFGVPGGGKAGPPTKLTFQQWDVRTHDVPFEFKDVPLP